MSGDDLKPDFLPGQAMSDKEEEFWRRRGAYKGNINSSRLAQETRLRKRKLEQAKKEQTRKEEEPKDGQR